MINQKINLELLSGSTTTLGASRSIFQTVVVLKIQKFQLRSQSFVSFVIQYTLMKKGILLPENIVLDGSPPKYMVFIIQCNELRLN